MIVLHLDEDPAVQAQFQELLARAEGEYALEAASTVKEAIERGLLLDHLDLLVTEAVLSLGTGWEVQAALKQRHRGLRTIYLTRYDLAEYKKELGDAPIVLQPPLDNLLEIMEREINPVAPPLPPLPKEPLENDGGDVMTPTDAPTNQLQSSHENSTVVPSVLPARFATGRTIVSSAPAKRPGAHPLSNHVPPGKTGRQGAAGRMPTGLTTRQPVPGKMPPGLTPRQPVPGKVPAGSTMRHPTVARVPTGATGRHPLATPPPPTTGPILLHPPSYQPGTLFGDYELLACMHVGDRNETYRALQKSVKREVALTLLRPALAQDQERIRAFRALVRQQAHVVHPYIAPVYEAGEEGNVLYFTRELLPDNDLQDLIDRGEKWDEKQTVHIIHAVAEAMHYLYSHGVACREMRALDIRLDSNNDPHLANLADPELETDPHASMRTFSGILSQLAQKGKPLQEAQAIATDFQTWHEVLEWSNARSQDLRDESSFQRLNRGIAPPPETQRRLALIAAALVVLTLLTWVIWMSVHQVTKPKAKQFDKMAYIAPGEFIYQAGLKRTLPGFDISAYEVTIADYATFLKEWSALPPEKQKALDHEDQPSTKNGHEPKDWEEFYPLAQDGGYFRTSRLDLNCPIFNVDWWDAYAYAKWKGHRLPTDEEWEKAARGTTGQILPGGKPFDPKMANLGKDYKIEGNGGQIDGYNAWAPVDAFALDNSVYDVRNMLGNVEEWTSTMMIHDELPDVEVPVVRGGSFSSTGEPTLLLRKASNNRLEAKVNRGFRTVKEVGK